MEQTKPKLSPFMYVVTWITRVMAHFASIAVGVMMFLTVADVIGRRFFLHPIEGSTEIVGILLVVASSLGFAWCQLTKGNIRIDFIANRLPRRGRALILIFSYILCIGISSFIAWRCLEVARNYLSKPGSGLTPLLGVQIWPFMIVLTISFGWVAFIFLIDLFRSFSEAFRR